MKFCRRFERFAANLVGCLSVKDYRFQYLSTRVTEGKFANQRLFKTTCINFLVWILDTIILFFSYAIARLPSNRKLQFYSNNMTPEFFFRLHLHLPKSSLLKHFPIFFLLINLHIPMPNQMCKRQLNMIHQPYNQIR